MNYENEGTRIITILDKNGTIKKFQVIDQINIDETNYIISLPYDKGFIEEKIAFIRELENDVFELVEDEETKNLINDHLTNITLNEELDFITFFSPDGEQIEYEIIDEVELDDNRYIVGVKKEDPLDSEDYTVFQIKGKNIDIVNDPEIIEDVMDAISENEFYDLDDSQITLKDGNNILDFNIIGKIEIYGKNYLISAPYDEIKSELVPILLENNKIVSYIKNHLISEDVSFLLNKITNYINKNRHKSRYFEDN